METSPPPISFRGIDPMGGSQDALAEHKRSVEDPKSKQFIGHDLYRETVAECVVHENSQFLTSDIFKDEYNGRKLDDIMTLTRCKKDLPGAQGASGLLRKVPGASVVERSLYTRVVLRETISRAEDWFADCSIGPLINYNVQTN